MEIRPFESTFKIIKASNTSLDAWLGAKMFSNSDNFKNHVLTKETYNEMGTEYLTEHRASNKYFQTPISSICNETNVILP